MSNDEILIVRNMFGGRVEIMPSGGIAYRGHLRQTIIFLPHIFSLPYYLLIISCTFRGTSDLNFIAVLPFWT